MAKPTLEERVVSAAEAALRGHHYVSPVDVLVGIGWLQPVHLLAWQKGRIPYLTRRDRVVAAMEILAAWAHEQGLQPSETPYFARTRSASEQLRFTESGEPEVERFFRTHCLSPDLPAPRRERLQQKLSKPPELVVYSLVKDSECSACRAVLESHHFLFMEKGQPLCLNCADLSHLLYLPRGDAALTRRARKYSKLSAVVVRWSRARKRYERQGLLVEEAALDRSEQECEADVDQRAERREREALRREQVDQDFVRDFAEEILRLFPGCPSREASAIASHAARRGSGRVGRTAAARELDPEPIRLATIAWIRHQHTDYDEQLMRGEERTLAREAVRARVNEVLDSWRSV